MAFGLRARKLPRRPLSPGTYWHTLGPLTYTQCCPGIGNLQRKNILVGGFLFHKPKLGGKSLHPLLSKTNQSVSNKAVKEAFLY